MMLSSVSLALGIIMVLLSRVTINLNSLMFYGMEKTGNTDDSSFHNKQRMNSNVNTFSACASLADYLI